MLIYPVAAGFSLRLYDISHGMGETQAKACGYQTRAYRF